MTSVPKPARGELLLLLSDTRARATLAGALDPPHRVRTLHHSNELLEMSRNESPVACIFDMFESRPPFPPLWFSAIRRSHPYLALLTASDFSGHGLDLYRIGEAGVDGVIRWDTNPSQREISAALDLAICAALARGVLSQFGQGLPLLTARALRWAIEHALESPQVSELAAALRKSPSGLARELRKAGTAPPRSVLVWGRLLVASHLMGRQEETVESVAFRLGYATGGSLGKAVNDYLGCNPTELLQRGGLAWASEAMGRALTSSKGKGAEEL